MSTIFLSHSSKDNAQAGTLQRQLEGQGYRSIFLDFDPEVGIPAGRNWERELYSQLLASQAVLILCSEHSMASEWCFAEITQARALGKFVVPLKIAACTVKSVLRDLQVLDFSMGGEANYEPLWRALAKAGLDPKDSFRWDPKRPPFPGLSPFEEADAAVYFGRESSIQQISDLLGRFRRLGNGRFALILGASGSGKSSLVQAGLLPRLRKNSAEWIIVEPFRPQERPLNQFALALAGTFEKYGAHRPWRDLRDELERAAAQPRSGRMVDLAYDLRETAKQANASVLITIDQMEELFVERPPDSFEQAMQQIVEPPDSPFVLVGCLRSDLFAGFQTRAPWDKLAFTPVPLNPMSIGELPAVIERPAQLAGLELEPGLVQAIVMDAETTDAMPLLAFTLRELWELAAKPNAGVAAGGRLTLHQYRDELGGLKTLLARKAEEAIAQDLGSDEVTAALRSAFSMLVRIDDKGGFARRPAQLESLPALALPAIQRLIQSRVLTARAGDDGHSVVEVAHEALFRAWDLLAHWLDADADFLFWTRRLQAGLREWQRTSNDDGALLRGAQLAEALEWMGKRAADIGAAEKDFIEASVSLSRRDRAALEFREWKARLEAGRALYERSFALSDQARLHSAAACALRAVEIAPPGAAPAGYESRPGSSNWASESWTRYRYLDAQRARMSGRLTGHQGPVTCVSVSADGNTGVSGGLDGSVRLWNLKTANQTRTLVTGETPVSCVALSSDGSTFLYGDVNGTVQEMDTAAAERLWSIKGQGEPVSCISYSSDGLAAVWGYKMGAVAGVLRSSGEALTYFRPHSGSVTALACDAGKRRLVTGSSRPALAEWLGDGGIQTWDLSTNKCTKVFAPQLGENLTALAIDSRGELALRGLSTGSIELMEVESERRLFHLSGHTNAVTTLVFADDGNTALSGSSDHMVRWWDLKTGACLRVLEGHTEPVLSVSFSSEAKIALSASSDGTIGVWDLREAAVYSPLSGHTTSVETVCIRRDGRRALSGASDGTAYLWDLETRQALQIFGKYVGPVTAVSLSSDGQTAAGALEDGVLLVWDLKTRTVRTVLAGHAGRVWDLAFSPDASRVFSASEDNTVRVWNLETGQCLHTLAGHTGTVYGLACGADGKSLLTGSADGTLRLWDTETGLEARVLNTAEPEGTGFTRIAWSPEGRIALAGTSQTTIEVWDIAAGKILRTLKGHAQQITRIVLIAGSHYAISASLDKTLRLWDFAKGECVRVFEGHTESVYSVALNGDGKLALSASMDHSLILWDVEKGKQLSVLARHTDGVTSVAMSRDGKTAVSGSLDKTMRVWDMTRRGASLILQEGHTAAVDSVTFTGANGEIAVTGSRDGTIRLWDSTTGRQLSDLPVQSRGVAGVASSRTGMIVAGYGDKSAHVWQQLAFGPLDGRTSLGRIGEGMIAVWDCESGGGFRLDRAGGQIGSVSLDSTGKRVLSGSWDGTARLWDIENRRQLQLLKHPAAVWSTAYDGERHLAICGCIDGSICAWDTESGKELRQFSGHTGGVGGIALSSDGETFFSASADKTVRQWRISDGEQTAIFTGHTASAITVAVSGDGRIVASGSTEGGIALWDAAKSDRPRFLDGHASSIWGLAFVANSNVLFSAAADGSVRLSDTDTGATVRTLKNPSGTLTAAAISSDGAVAFLAAEDGTISVQELASGKELGVLRGNKSGILGIGCARAKPVVAIGCQDGEVRSWDLDTSAEPMVTHSPVGEVLTVALDPTGETMVIGCADGLVWIWSLRGECFGSLQGHSAPVTSSAISADGAFAFTGSLDGTIRIWDLANWALVRVLSGPAKGVTSIALCPDGKALLAGYADSVTRLWDLTTGKLLRTFEGEIVTGIAISNDGSYALVTATSGKKTELVLSGEGAAGMGLSIGGPTIKDIGVVQLLNADTPAQPPDIHPDAEDPYSDFASFHRSVGLRVIREGAGMGDIEVV